MAIPIREQVNAALAAALTAALPNDYVERNRTREVPAAFDEITPGTPARFAVIHDGPQSVINDDFGAKLITTTPTLEGFVKVATQAEVGPALSLLYADVLVAVLADHTLGGVAIDVREGELNLLIDEEGSTYTGAFSLDLDIDYQVKPVDPFTLGP